MGKSDGVDGRFPVWQSALPSSTLRTGGHKTLPPEQQGISSVSGIVLATKEKLPLETF